MSGEILATARDLAQHYGVPRGPFAPAALLKAVDGVSFTLRAGRTLAVVGESGCGKSTLARMVTMIERPTSGHLMLAGTDLADASAADVRSLRREVQMVFQNPYGSLNPRQKIGTILEEPLVINEPAMTGVERSAAAHDMLERVGLRPECYGRYPHMFSGGQRQRIAIARALMLKPRILILDEPVSALDLSVQAQVLNLLIDLQAEFDLAYMFISHGLSVVRHIADEIMVMYLGRAVEQGAKDEIFARPKHPYTQALLSATPVADPAGKRARIRLTGELPSPIAPPPGCAFNPRCPVAFDRCRKEAPPVAAKGGVDVACFAVADDGTAPTWKIEAA